LNIQRGRDHGLADYNSLRAVYGLPKVTSFAQITSDVALQGKLQQLYGSVNNIDAWVGMLAEDHVPGTSVGALIQRVLVDQFTRLRDGDRFWYQKSLSGQQLKDVESTTLTDVIRRNTQLTNLQQNAFFFKVEIRGRVVLDGNRDGLLARTEQGLGGRTVELVDAETNEVVGSTKTDPQGVYRFDIQNGLGVGDYLVREVTPTGWTETAKPTKAITITRGDQSFANVDFGQVQTVVAPPPTNPTPTNPPKPPPPPPPRSPAPPRSPQRIQTATDNGTTTTKPGASTPKVGSASSGTSGVGDPLKPVTK
jgi:hypothetical protein